jgi:hypothetical protein
MTSFWSQNLVYFVTQKHGEEWGCMAILAVFGASDCQIAVKSDAVGTSGGKSVYGMGLCKPKSCIPQIKCSERIEGCRAPLM